MKPFEIPPRIIYTILIVILVIPLIKPMGLPLALMQDSKKLYDAINALQPGQRILFSCDWSDSVNTEIYPNYKALIQHAFQRPGVKIYLISFMQQGPLFAEQILGSIDRAGKAYGKDYVNLGFVPGAEAAIGGFAKNPVGFVKADFGGKPTAGMAVMEGIQDAKSFDLVVCVDVSTPGASHWIRQVQIPYGVKMACVSNLVGMVTVTPYVQSGQLFALIAGVRGAAEYESLTKKPGLSSASMDAQSIGHIFILILLFLGNWNRFVEKKRQSARREEVR